MYRRVFQYVFGILPIAYVVGNLCFWIVPVTILSAVKAVVPIRHVRTAIYWLLVWIYALAVRCNDFLFFSLLRIRLDVRGLDEILSYQSYVVIANHQSWNDIFILQHLLTHPPATVKFLVKRELMYLPIINLICWAYDYPFLRRYSREGLQHHPERRGEDIRTIGGVVERLGRSPAVIVNLVEGTRFSPAKARTRRSPYAHLLLPKAGGFVYILCAMGHRLHGVIDLTIVYDCPSPSFWGFVSGSCRRIVVRAKETPLSDIFGPQPADGEEFDAAAVVSWLNTAWARKDKQINGIRRYLALDSS